MSPPGGSVLPLLFATLALALGATAAVAADPPRLTEDQVADLLADAAGACTFSFVETFHPTPHDRVERWRATGCDGPRLWNLQSARVGDDRLAVTVLLPGATRQAPSVQRTATLAVLARAAPADCRDRRIVDTEIVERTDGGTVERWTAHACGARHTFRLTFGADADGPPSVDIAPADTGGAVPTALSR
jgi:hypothetical protein